MVSATWSDQIAAATVAVPAELVQAALRAADALGRQVADVPVAAIAAEAGISRSTLLRRLGGSRSALDAAVRATGVDPGGLPVRVRALDAAADLISYEIDVSGDPSIIVHQGIPGVERPRSTKGGVRFAAYPNRPASAVMAEWLALAQRFVADFVRDHAHLLP